MDENEITNFEVIILLKHPSKHPSKQMLKHLLKHQLVQLKGYC